MSDAAGRDYRATLNLPTTAFPMKADLPTREPDRVAWWSEHDVYGRRLRANADAGAKPWILHDGPPYANGELHMGTFLNMVLKDVFVKIALLDGRRATFVPGWDMHGLPIELETLKHLGIKDFHAIDPLELRAKCKERALYWLGRQRETRQRMGAFGDFAHPYRTIDPSFEATIVQTLATLAERDQLYKGLRATLWCTHDETALAEAEIEYENARSPSIYVRFALSAEQRHALRDALQRKGVPLDGEMQRRPAPELPERTSVLIWTTTPWTLPANVAIAVRKDALYGLYRLGDEILILANALASSALGDRFDDAELVAQIYGEDLEGLVARHPFLDRDSVIVLADYVDLETGTGAVHTAPGHGAEDFETGVKYGLSVLNPVDATGRFTNDAGPYAGRSIWKANGEIVEDLRASGALLRSEEYEHSYPHCWRCHNPVIFRATAQWFIAMDRNDLRARAIQAAERVAYTPAWGETRMRQMLENHPEWCVSRQRTWGTPIPALICTACGESFLDPAVARAAAARFAREGADSWWSEPVDAFVPPGTRCPSCGGERFEKEKNIVDIWFESGVTHLAVLGKDGLPWPSDMVLEGGDQFRGWFRSSLVTAVAVKGGAPYRRIVKNGWVNDEQGRPMSKSRGTGIDARDAMQRWGADVLRLWAASVEFVDDVRFGPNVVAQVGNVYRNIRNRIRYMLSNLADLHARDVVPRERMAPLDRLACSVVDALVADVKDCYDRFEIHDAYLRVVAFESAMSSFYFDALKDPLYSWAKDGNRRRSAQSALLYALRRFLTVVAPVLSFTAEEAWQALPNDLRGDAPSIFDTTFADEEASVAESERPVAQASARNARTREDDLALWETLRGLRGRVAATVSPRDFEARVTLTVAPALYRALNALGDNLREALIVSQLELRESMDQADEHGVVALEITPADGEKCTRCWKYRELGVDPSHPDVCAVCAQIVGGAA